jgi:hypothetical protein
MGGAGGVQRAVRRAVPVPARLYVAALVVRAAALIARSVSGVAASYGTVVLFVLLAAAPPWAIMFTLPGYVQMQRAGRNRVCG